MFKRKPTYYDEQMAEYRRNYRVAPEVERMYELCRGSMPASVAFCLGVLSSVFFIVISLFVVRTIDSGDLQWLTILH